MAMTALSAEPEPFFTARHAATEHAVRDIMDALRKSLEASDCDADLIGSTTIVVAEALNNVVEHAYADQTPGPMAIEATDDGTSICISITDEGRGLPNAQIPVARLPDASGPLETLPEGGFGWYLIHDLTSSLSYRRDGNVNRLDMVLPRNQKFSAS